MMMMSMKYIIPEMSFFNMIINGTFNKSLNWVEPNLLSSF